MQIGQCVPLTVDLSSEPSCLMCQCTVAPLLTTSLDLKKHFRTPVVPFSTITSGGALMSTANVGRVPGSQGKKEEEEKKKVYKKVTTSYLVEVSSGAALGLAMHTN